MVVCTSGPVALVSCALAVPRALTLRRARLLLGKIKSAYGKDDSAPLNVMANCEAQLAFLENWLLGRSGKNEQAVSKDATKRLALPNGLASKEAEADFFKLFPASEDETLVQELDCSARSLTCFLSGSLFVTNARLCFSSRDNSVKASLSLPWHNVQRIRAIVPKTDKGRTDQGERVKQGILIEVLLLDPIEFDGLQTECLEVITFDTSAVVVLQRSSDMFASRGAFQEVVAASDISLTKAEMEKINQSKAKQLEGTNEVWELQRRTAILMEDWQKPFLPIDSSVQFATWTVLNEATGEYVFHPQLSETESWNDRSPGPPIERMFALGCDRQCEWKVLKHEDLTDEDGWQYSGLSFSTARSAWMNHCGHFSLIRRRLWRAEFPDLSGGPMEIPRSTLAELTCKKTDSIYTEELGDLPLATLAEWLEADDWEAEGTFMAASLEDQGASERQIEPWASEDHAEAKKVHGKLRTLKMRVPVPPQPMCPPTTMVEQTVHVWVEADQVTKETATLSLDVPYGTCFRTVICDTFTVTAGGATQMERRFGLEWLQSTMMKSMIEMNVPPNLIEDAKKGVAFMKRWLSGDVGDGPSGASAGGKATSQGQNGSKRNSDADLQAGKGAQKRKQSSVKRAVISQGMFCCSGDNRSMTEELSDFN
eukprot:TRINITY_DN77310_c0_g1_i1.p1 TRINITY_DN77310_c0_g1~~TRINITY_DN77310_c0_g1_i1.p1  ORF type:complete len:653 (+),score=153.40 TRINITY_DN77310_c0_g1_i1:28-1986(+)